MVETISQRHIQISIEKFQLIPLIGHQDKAKIGITVDEWVNCIVGSKIVDQNSSYGTLCVPSLFCWITDASSFDERDVTMHEAPSAVLE